MTADNTEQPGENIADTSDTANAAPAESSNASNDPATVAGNSRVRSAMSARVNPEDQTTRQRNVDDAAMHARTSGKRRDLLSYLRLRRHKS